MSQVGVAGHSFYHINCNNPNLYKNSNIRLKHNLRHIKCLGVIFALVKVWVVSVMAKQPPHATCSLHPPCVNRHAYIKYLIFKRRNWECNPSERVT